MPLSLKKILDFSLFTSHFKLSKSLYFGVATPTSTIGDNMIAPTILLAFCLLCCSSSSLFAQGSIVPLNDSAFANHQPTPAGTIALFGLDEHDRQKPIERVVVQECRSSTVHSLLNYIFFDTGSADIPDRYVQLNAERAQAFKTEGEELLGSTALDVYYNTLNIIGYRMKRYPDAVLTLTGCNNHKGIEDGNLTLSQNRAEAVKAYLMNTWGVDEKRLTVVARHLPREPSSRRTLEGTMENSRVEIVSSIPEIIDAVEVFDLVYMTTPIAIRFKPVSTEPRKTQEESHQSWELKVMQDSILLRTFSGTGSRPIFVDWDIQDESVTIPRTDKPLSIQMTLEGLNGRTTILSNTLLVETISLRDKKQRGAQDYRIDRYNLGMFKFDSDHLTPMQERVIERLRSKLGPASHVTLVAYRDHFTPKDRAMSISRSQMGTVRKALEGTGRTIIEIEKPEAPYENTLPEERFLSRTVQITTKTPIK